MAREKNVWMDQQVKDSIAANGMDKTLFLLCPSCSKRSFWDRGERFKCFFCEYESPGRESTSEIADEHKPMSAEELNQMWSLGLSEEPVSS